MRKGDREKMAMTRTGRCVGAVWRSGRYRAEDIIGVFKAGGEQIFNSCKEIGRVYAGGRSISLPL